MQATPQSSQPLPQTPGQPRPPRQAPPAVWRNRIVGSGMVDPAQLLTNPRNWRIHPKHQREALTSILRDVGWVQDVIVNKRTGFVVDGHLRIALALGERQPAIPVQYVDLSEEEEALVLATLDPVAALSLADHAKLGELLQTIQTEDAAIQALLGKLAEDSGVTTFDPMQEWQAMPAFENPDAFGAVHTLKVHFASHEAIAEFARLVGQTVTEHTRFIWYPKQEPMSWEGYRASYDPAGAENAAQEGRHG